MKSFKIIGNFLLIGTMAYALTTILYFVIGFTCGLFNINIYPVFSKVNVIMLINLAFYECIRTWLIEKK